MPSSGLIKAMKMLATSWKYTPKRIPIPRRSGFAWIVHVPEPAETADAVPLGLETVRLDAELTDEKSLSLVPMLKKHTC